MKTLSISAFSAVAIESNEITNAGIEKFHLANKLLVTSSNQEPVMIVNIFVVRKDISCFVEQDLLKTVLTDKLKERSTTKKGEFRVNFLRKGLQKIGIKDEEELFEKFPNLEQIAILLNDTNKSIDITIPEKATVPKVFSSV